MHQEVDTQVLVLHQELVAILELEHLLEQEVIQVQGLHLVLEDILGVNLGLQEVATLEQEHQASLELQEVDILELVHLVVGILVLELHQVNMEVLLFNKWTHRLPSGSKQWIRITVGRLMLKNWAKLWLMGI